MPSYPWFKVDTDIFDDEEMVRVLTGDQFRHWVFLLALARNSGDSLGVIPKSVADIAWRLHQSVRSFRASISVFQRLGYIQVEDGSVTILKYKTRYGAYPSDSPEAVRERVRRHRAKRNADVTSRKQDGNRAETGIEVELELELDREKEKEKDSTHPVGDDSPTPAQSPPKDDNNFPVTCERVAELWNEICSPVLPVVAHLNNHRRKQIGARCREVPRKQPRDEAWWRTYFRRIMSSAFLRGDTDKWRGATFDWVIGPKNMVKVLEGNYDDKRDRTAKPASPSSIATKARRIYVSDDETVYLPARGGDPDG